MKIEEYVWFSLVFVLVFFGHVSLGWFQVQINEEKIIEEGQVHSAELFKNIRLKKVIV